MRPRVAGGLLAAYEQLDKAARGLSADLYRRGAADHGRSGDIYAVTAALADIDRARAWARGVKQNA